MADNIFKFLFGSAKNLNARFFCFQILFLCSFFFLTGCGTVTSYKSNLPSGPPKSADYPIPVFMQEQDTVPRPCTIIGTISYHDTILTYGSEPIEKVLLKILRVAREKGADAVEITSLINPEMKSPNYRVAANVLRYSDIWETIPISQNDFRAYLKKNARTLDPIEGIWSETGEIPEQIGIMKSNSKRGRDFVGFILNSPNPAWPLDAKKLDIRRGADRGSYILTYYLADFEPRSTTIILGKKPTFTLAVQRTDDEGDLIVFTKN
jgi:hypothetical protein